MNFFFDEWDFVQYARPWTLNVLLLPHNEHWSTVPVLIWKLLFIVVGLRSHIPYEAVLLVAHVAAVLLLFTLVRRRSGDLPAFAAGLILLVLGSGGTDIVWAFQIGFVGSVAFGLLAMRLLDGNPPFPSRMFLASAALLGSVMSSGVGLAFVVAIGIELAIDRERRRFLLALVAPSVAFAEWFLAYGAGLPGSPGAPCASCVATGFAADVPAHLGALAYLLSLSNFVITGLAACAAGIVGLPPVGWAPLILLIVSIAVRWRHRRWFTGWRVGMAAGLLAWFGLVSLGRAQFGPGAASDSHYVYIGVVFLLPLLADVTRDLPAKGVWLSLVGGALILSVTANTLLLREAALSRVDTMRAETAELQTVEYFRGAPDMALNRGLDDTIMPQLNAGPFLAAVDEFGSPVPPATEDDLRRQPQAVDQAMANLFGTALSLGVDRNRSTQGLWCEAFDPSSGLDLDLLVPDGKSLFLQAGSAGSADLFLAYVAPVGSKPLKHVIFEPGVPNWIYLPNTGRPVVWHLRMHVVAGSLLRVCGTADTRSSLPPLDQYRAPASSGKFTPGWILISDPAASGHRAVKASQGTMKYNGIVFGTAFLPAAGAYDLYYRLRVANAEGATSEMTLSLLDATSGRYMAADAVSATQIGTSYTWYLVSSKVVPTPGHLMRFQTNVASTLGTDWFIDSAALVPTGTSPV
jgi:hypothetical protein